MTFKWQQWDSNPQPLSSQTNTKPFSQTVCLETKWLWVQILLLSLKITTDHDHEKHITTQEFNKLTSENFAARLAQANLASKNDIPIFEKKIGFNKELKRLNENQLNELSKIVKAISLKGLWKNLINKFIILNG